MGAAAMLYGALAVGLTWPIALHFQTAIVGGGDAYHHLWGLWWFEKALGHPSAFWSCPLVFHPYGASLILDDWPLGPSLLALTARGLGFTLIGSYNASLLLAIWLNALSVFTLVRAVVKEWLPAIVAGLFFAFSPFFWGRLHGHLAFMHAYPLALVALCAYKSQQSRSPRWALGVGGSLALAVWSEYCYAVYAGFYLVLAYVYEVSPVSLKIERRHTSRPQLQVLFLIVGLLAGIVAVIVSLQGGLEGPPGGVWGSVYRVARPMVIWWASWLVVFVLRYRLIAVRREKAPTPPWNDPRFWGYAALPLILLLPVFVGVAQLAASGDFPALKLNLKPEFSGAYALSAVFPNIYHSLWGHVFQHRLASWSLLERGSIGLGWAAIILVLGTKTHKVAGWWMFAFSVFLVLSFGPFLEIAPGLDQGPILPFWILRYVPVLSEARVPSRWIALALVAGSVLVGLGFQRIRSQGGKALAIGAIVFEGLALPLRVVTPVVPDLYQTIARDHQAGALLQLPFGACDGRGCWGDVFPAEHLYYQTVHQRPVVGGYLSRLSKKTRRQYQDERILQQLVALQKNRTDPSLIARLAASIDGNSFFRWTADWGITWVTMDRSRASTALDGAVRTLLGEPLLVQGHVVGWRVGPLPDDTAAGAE